MRPSRVTDHSSRVELLLSSVMWRAWSKASPISRPLLSRIHYLPFIAFFHSPSPNFTPHYQKIRDLHPLLSLSRQTWPCRRPRLLITSPRQDVYRKNICLLPRQHLFFSILRLESFGPNPILTAEFWSSIPRRGSALWKQFVWKWRLVFFSRLAVRRLDRSSFLTLFFLKGALQKPCCQ